METVTTAGSPIQRHPDPVARVMGLSSMTLSRPDRARARRFFTDFGLSPVEASGNEDADEPMAFAGVDGRAVLRIRSGPRAALFGLTFAASEHAVEAIARAEGAPLEPTAEPASPVQVELTDPNGWRIRIVAAGDGETGAETGFETTCATPSGQPPVAAAPRINAPLRLPARPPEILRLGHVALEVVDFDASVAWYTRVLGLLPSDVQVLDDGTPGLVFLRCDRGATPVEHHTIVLARSVQDALSHAAFAVADLDALAMGQRVMRDAGWDHGWGIGRHLMGSQLFDYWRDPWGAMMEHYADSDLLDARHEPDVIPMGRDAMAQWGPPMPADFVDTRLTPRRVLTVLRNLRTRPPLTLRRVMQLKRAMEP